VVGVGAVIISCALPRLVSRANTSTYRCLECTDARVDYGNTAGIIPRGVGTAPTRSASLYSSAGSAGGDVGLPGPPLPSPVRTFQEQRTQTSRHASRPPSSDPPSPARLLRPRSIRRRGGQPGHAGQTRPLVPVEDIDAVDVRKPEQCRRCHAPFSGDDPTPLRPHGLEIPPLKPVSTAYQWPQLGRPECRATTCALWPAGVPSGTSGSRVHALVALCTGASRLSKRTTQHGLDDLFGVPMSGGTTSQSAQATTEGRGEPVEEARGAVATPAVVHVDETR
jgi:hypothetical protein